MAKEKRSHGRTIAMISNKIKRLADENLLTENVTMEQVGVMKMIFENGGQVNQKDIEVAFGVRRSTVTSSMQILEKKGYIVRTQSPDDSRAKIVVLTECGKEKNKRLKNYIMNLEEKMLCGFSESEKEELSSFLQRILENIDN